MEKSAMTKFTKNKLTIHFYEKCLQSSLKKNIILLILLMVSIIKVEAQTNLIYNGSLEEKRYCPEDIAIVTTIQGWYSPTEGTPDVFCRGCTDIMHDSVVPINHAGCQEPASGDNYGLISTTGLEDYREYLGVKLTYPYLKKDSLYAFEIKFSLCDCSGAVCRDCIMVAFADSVVRSNTIGVLPLKPAIVFDTLVADTKNWITLKGQYRASGKENIVIVGNFKSNKETTYFYRKYKSKCDKGKDIGATSGSSYYIDDLKMYKVSE